MLRYGGRKVLKSIADRVIASEVLAAVVRNEQKELLVGSRTMASTRWFTSNYALNVAAAEGSADLSSKFGIATGLEAEELEAQAQGKKRFDLDAPRGPFGTKDHPAIVESQFDERIVGCSGGVGEDEHDVTWFKLKKDEEFSCPVCTQVFQLKVVGEGGLPGHGHH